MTLKGKRMNNTRKSFGFSVAVDLYGVNSYACKALDFNYRALEDLAAHINMKTQAPPWLFVSPVPDTHEKAGLSGFLPLIESGITIHTLSNKGFVTIDVYTCGQVEELQVVDFLRTRYDSKDEEWQSMSRGTKYHDL
jgi:S-adenosylmethionine/arginine decarboxylase-like enzyme